MSNDVPQVLFKLEKIVDDPRFEGFAVEDAPSRLGRESLNDDLHPGYPDWEINHRWKPTFLKPTWKAPRVTGRVSPFNDYPGMNMVYPVFSRRACEVLEPLLRPNGEVLPLRSDTAQKYFFYNITTISDALDIDKSKCDWGTDDRIMAMDIDYFVFHQQKLKGLSIFRLYQRPSFVFVTDAFVQRVDECGLNGFHFIKVWPYPKGVHWREAAKKKEKAKGVKQLKRHTLLIRLWLKGNEPDAAEKRAIKQLEDDLDAQLAVRSLCAPLFGCYDGSDIADGEFRMFLAAPDADKLEQKLLPWLKAINWPRRAEAIKRYGDLYDQTAEERLISLR